MANLFKVDYTDPTFGLEPPLPLFIVTDTDMLPPSACDILRRQDHTKDIIVFIKLFNLPFQGGVVWVPYHLLHHKSLKTSLKIKGLYNGLRHGQYLFQCYCPNLDITKEEVIKQIDSFVELTAEISSDLKLNIRGYLRRWIFKFFEVCCVHIDVVDTQDVKCFDDAMNHVGRDIKAWYVLRHAIDVVKASMSYPRNRKVLIGFVMSHRNMDIIVNKSKKVQNFAERLIKSTVGGISEAFDNRWGKSLGPGCVWEEKKFKVKTVHTRAYPIFTRPPQHVPCGMAFHPTAAYGAVANNLVNNAPHPYPNSMVGRHTQIMESSHPYPAAPFFPAEASPTSFRQTPSVLTSLVTPSYTLTTPPPSNVPQLGLNLATNLDHASPSLNDSSVGTEATTSPFNTYTVSHVIDPLTLEMNMVNEHAKASAASTTATIVPAPAPALASALAPEAVVEVEVAVEIVTEVVTEALARAALTTPHNSSVLPMINPVGTRTFEDNIAKATTEEEELELALATQKAESQKQEVAAKQKAELQKLAENAELQKQKVASAKQKAEFQKQEEKAELQKQEVAAAKQIAEFHKQEEKAELRKQEVAAAIQKAEFQKQEEKAELQKQQVAVAKQKAELQKQEEKAELQIQEVLAAKQKVELQKQDEKAELQIQEVLAAKTKSKVAPVAEHATNKLIAFAAKAQTLPSKITRVGSITDVLPAKKKSKVSSPDLILSFCSNQHNHAGKLCSFDCLKEERDIHYYGITGDLDEYGEPPICGNQSSNCCLRTKESWKKSFSKKKPTLYCCQHCIAITHVDGEQNDDGYTPPFFLCKNCYDDVSVGKHPNLASISQTRNRRGRRM
jgi:hypothetical protein